MQPGNDISRPDALAGYTAVILIGLGIVQIVFGEFFSESVALVANGIDCIGDGFVSATVWAGLLYFQRPADDRFHFGYYKLENLASIAAAIVMFILAGYIFYRSYQRLVDPHPVTLPAVGIALASIAAVVALALGIYKKRAGRDTRLRSVKLEAFNTIKDGSASALTVVALLLSSAGFPVADAVVGFAIAVAIVSIGFISIKESSAMLVDACDSQCLLQSQVIRRITRGIDGILEAKFIRLRRSGPVLQGELEIVVPRHLSIAEVYDIRQRILDHATEEVPELERLAITAIPAESDGDEQPGNS
ncbi:MAG: cation transporter [Candidatus Thermoplasmatota archaeon]|nr:cation transporter [Candidatus Thermoplasmatota archaeon]